MGRRWGKSTLGLVLEGTFAAMGGRCAWVVPQFKNGYPLWSMLKTAFAEHKAHDIVRIWENDRRLEVALPYGGGFVGMYSADDDADSIRGDAFDLVVVDEAAKLSERAIYDAILPTLADKQGKLVAISTPRGRNWFWREWQRGQDYTQQETRSFSAPSSANPMPQIRTAFEKARAAVSDRTFRQEWLAEFVDDTGGVFRDVRACQGGSLEDRPKYPFSRYVTGCDLAKLEDFTVLVTVDVRERQIVAFDRFNKASWPLQKQRIFDHVQRWNNAHLVLDTTGIGDPIYDDLLRMGLSITPYKLTHASKMALIDNAIVTIEQQLVHWPAELTTLTNELEAYEYEKTPAGVIRANAPEGMHDDCVIAFANMCWGLGHGGSVRLSTAVLEQLRMPETARAPFGGMNLMRKKI